MRSLHILPLLVVLLFMVSSCGHKSALVIPGGLSGGKTILGKTGSDNINPDKKGGITKEPDAVMVDKKPGWLLD